MKLIKKRDLIFALAILVIAAGMFAAFYFAGSGEAVCAVITVNKEDYKTLPLEKDATCPVSANGHTLTVVVKNGAVGVVNADCPDKVCEKTGFVNRPGAVIVCVPAGVTVRVSGDPEVPYDAKTK